MAPGDAYSLLKLGLLSPADLGWMLRELPGLPAPARDTIARCVSPLARNPETAEASLILGMDAAHPAYPYTGWLREPLSTGSELARRSRREQQENADEARRRAASITPGCWNAWDGPASR